MKIKTQENAINFDDLKHLLESHFSGQYDISTRTKNLLVVAKTNTIGATVLLQKKAIIVNGNFPSMKSQMIFTVLVVAGGIVIPLIIYFIMFHKKMKVVEQDVGAFIKTQFHNQLVQVG